MIIDDHRSTSTVKEELCNGCSSQLYLATVGQRSVAFTDFSDDNQVRLLMTFSARHLH